MSEAGSKNPKEAARADAKAAKASKRREVNTGTNVALGEHAREAGYVPRFKKRYNDVIKAELMKKFGYTNAMQVPKLNKVVLNIGAGEAASDGKKITAGGERPDRHRRPEGGADPRQEGDRDLQDPQGPADRRQGHAARRPDVRIRRPPDHHGAAARARLPRRQSQVASTAAATMPWA